MMHEALLRTVVAALWAAWLLSWALAACDAKTTRWRESPMSQVPHRVPLVLAIFLLVAPSYLPSFMTRRFLPPSFMIGILGLAMVAAGWGFALWARLCLGP